MDGVAAGASGAGVEGIGPGCLGAALRERLSFTAEVRPVAEGALPRTALKTKYVRIDG